MGDISKGVANTLLAGPPKKYTKKLWFFWEVTPDFDFLSFVNLIFENLQTG
jgi:hypothetical protein